MPRKYTTRSKNLKQSKKGGPKSSRMTSPLTARLGQGIAIGTDQMDMHEAVNKLSSPNQNYQIGAVPTPPPSKQDTDIVQLSNVHKVLEIVDSFLGQIRKLQAELSELDPMTPHYHTHLHHLASTFEQYIHAARTVRSSIPS